MPFSSSQSLDGVFDGLPPLEEDQPTRPAAQSLWDGLESLHKDSSSGSGKSLWRLCLIDDAGRPTGYPSDADLHMLIHGGRQALGGEQPAAASPQQQHAEPTREPSFQELLAETHKKGGPLCTHCGATESPQWRRGPPNKAILCNACGTRYRRTNQLGSSVPSTQRKRQAQHCGGQAMKQHGPVAKQPRVSVA